MKLRQARRCSCEIFVRLYIVTQQVCDPPLRTFYLSAAAARGAPRAILARVPSGDIPQCPRTLAESPLPRTFHSTETGCNSCLRVLVLPGNRHGLAGYGIFGMHHQL